MAEKFDIAKAYALHEAWRAGRLGGERMPEDANPGLDRDSVENYLYFTLPMALNYQRNSYVMWGTARKTYCDEQTTDVFYPAAVIAMPEEELREKLTRYKLALQPNKQPAIWRTLCQTVQEEFCGDIRLLFSQNGFSVRQIKEHIAQNKKKYPYLGGEKICNYWLYVMEQYTDVRFCDRHEITVAPDTHVIAASIELGIITAQEAQKSNVHELTASRWREALEGSGLLPIDMHTPMWLWSRSGFEVEI